VLIERYIALRIQRKMPVAAQTFSRTSWNDFAKPGSENDPNNKKMLEVAWDWLADSIYSPILRDEANLHKAKERFDPLSIDKYSALINTMREIEGRIPRNIDWESNLEGTFVVTHSPNNYRDVLVSTIIISKITKNSRLKGEFALISTGQDSRISRRPERSYRIDMAIY
jgi:hypothetical protein